jgi:2,3-dihydroxy-2,3-dihydro-p-cumate dehydrogenase
MAIAQTQPLDPRARARLRGKAAIVTGAARGIGRATALRLAEEGARLVLADLDADALAAVVDEATAGGADAPVPFAGDLTEYQVAEALIRACQEAWGTVDVLVNNVGGATMLRPYAEWAQEDVLPEIMRSLLPTAWCCRAVLPVMLGQGSGRIVNVGAESVRNGLWDRAPYNMAKGAVHALTTSIARETAETGITCNCVAPAATGRQEGRLSRRAGRSFTAEEESRVASLNRRMLETIPMGRPALPEEQAAAIAFLASDDASFITGQVLSVNGGSSML